MNKNRTISIFALMLLVLLSSSNFMIGIHICSDEIRDVRFLAKAEACEKERELPPCHRHMTAPCCEDETIVHEGDELKNSVSHLHVPAPVAADLALLPVIIAEVIPASAHAHADHYPYDPPLRWDDITITNHVLLI